VVVVFFVFVFVFVFVFIFIFVILFVAGHFLQEFLFWLWFGLQRSICWCDVAWFPCAQCFYFSPIVTDWPCTLVAVPWFAMVAVHLNKRGDVVKNVGGNDVRGGRRRSKQGSTCGCGELERSGRGCYDST